MANASVAIVSAMRKMFGLRFLALFAISLEAVQCSELNTTTQSTTNQNDQGFICVQGDTCKNSTGSQLYTTSCPTGYTKCSTDGQNFLKCGLRSVTINTTDDLTVFGAYPWQAYIITNQTYIGSGVLIDEYHVITVAHKFYQQNISDFHVYMGVWHPANITTSLSFNVVNIITHPNFAKDTLHNDIAVLRLASPVPLDLNINIGTACLPLPFSSYVGKNISGWGESYFGANDASVGPQRHATIPIVDYQTCRLSMSRPDLLHVKVDQFLDRDGEICAGGQAQSDACTLDGGAPLVCPDEGSGRFYVVGLVSWGIKCGLPGVYGVYVNVASYRRWLDVTIDMLRAG